MSVEHREIKINTKIQIILKSGNTDSKKNRLTGPSWVRIAGEVDLGEECSERYSEAASASAGVADTDSDSVRGGAWAWAIRREVCGGFCPSFLKRL